MASCTKNPAKVLPKNEGKWNVTYTETTGSKVENGSGTLTFTETSITQVDNAFPSLALTGTWSYNKSSEEITITILGTSTVFKVTDMTRTSQTWTNEEKGTTVVYKLVKA